MRWKYLIPRFVLLGLMWAFFAFCFDPLVRFGLVSTGEFIAGARVEVDGLQTQFFPPGLSMNNVQVANQFRPGRNLVTFDRLNVRLRGDALLMKRFVVESGEVSGIEIGDRRDDDGLLEEPDGDSVLDEYSDHFRRIGAEWLDDLLAQARLELDHEQLETWKVGEEIHKKWDQRFQGLRSKVAALEPRAKDLETAFRVSGRRDPLGHVRQFQQAAAETRSLVSEAQSLTAALRGLPAEVQQDMQRLNAARLRDQDAIKSRAALLKPDPAKITQLLFGPEMTKQLRESLGWLQTAKRYKDALSAKSAEPTRSRGIDILFPVYERHPLFLMNDVRLSGSFSFRNEQLPFEAVICGVTSDPVLHGKPIRLTLDAGARSSLRMVAEFDRTGSQAINRLSVVADDARASRSRLGDDRSLVVDVLAGMSHWDCRFEQIDGALNGTIDLSQAQVALAARGERISHPALKRVLDGVLGSIDQIDCRLNVEGTAAAPRLSVRSNVGETIATGLRTALLEEVEVQKTRLAQKAEAFAAQEITSVKTRLSAEYSKLVGEHGDLIQHVNLVRDLVPNGGSAANPADVFRSVSRNRIVRDKVSEALGGSKTTDKMREQIERFNGLGNFGSMLPPGLLPRGSSQPNEQRSRTPKKKKKRRGP